MARDSKSKVEEKMKQKKQEQPKNPEEVEKKKNPTEEGKKKKKQCKYPEENTRMEVDKEKMKEKMEKKKQPNNPVEAEKTTNTTEEEEDKKQQPKNLEVERNENSTDGVKKKEKEKMKRKWQPDDPEVGNEKDTTEEVKKKEKEKKRKKQPNYSEVETTEEMEKEEKKNQPDSSEGVAKNKKTTEEVKKKKKKKMKQPKNPEEVPEQQEQQQEEIKTKIKDNNCESRTQVKTEQKQTVNNNNKRKLKEVFPHGNYRSYYGYRIGQGSEEDPRLKAFKREWFEGKDCLDIGCNSGIVTIQIAKKFSCRTMLGIDIDPERISDARWNLKRIMRAECSGNPSTKAARLDATENVNGSEHTAALSHEREKNARDGSPFEERDLFDIVSFRQENFVESQRPTGKDYDTILCLSVTKWVHLNCGDDGLITLFSKIWELLRPGGMLVLEPQPWKSYEKNRRVSDVTAKNFPSITLYPESFQEILLDKIGFIGVEDITSGLSGTKTGFDRPIFTFRK